MKRIVIDARESGTSTGRYIDKLIEYLHDLQPEYNITLLSKPPRIEFLRRLAPNFEVLPAPYKEFTFAEQLKFWRQIRSLKPDLVHFPMVQQPVFYKGLVVTTMQDLTGIRFKNPNKNPFAYRVKQIVYKWVNKKVAKKSVALITPTEFVKKDVANYCGVSPKKITVTLESADKLKDKPEPVSAVGDKRFIFYVGRPMPHKNLERLVEAFAILHAKDSDLYLVLGGKTDANFESLQKYSHERTDGVIYTDFVTEGQLRWLYEHAAVYAFPSLSEGFGLPGLEAMQYDLPVVSSNATCLPEVYKDGALYFDPLDVEDMAAKIAQVLDDKKLAADLVAKGAKLIKTYSWERMARQTLEVYRKVLDA